MDKRASLWSFVRKHKYLITLALFAVIIGFLDENSVVRRLGYAREESRLRDEIEKYRYGIALQRHSIAHNRKVGMGLFGTNLLILCEFVHFVLVRPIQI